MVCKCACGFGSIVNLFFVTFSTFELSHFWCLSTTDNACLRESTYTLEHSVLQKHFLVTS